MRIVTACSAMILTEDPDGIPDHDNCKKWCNSNDNCEGFAVSEQKKCYFKSYECGNDIQRGRAVLYTKMGKCILK